MVWFGLGWVWLVGFVEQKEFKPVKFLASPGKYNYYIPLLSQHLMLWMSVFLCKEPEESSEAFPSLSLPKLFWNDTTKILDVSKVFDVVSYDTMKPSESRTI